MNHASLRRLEAAARPQRTATVLLADDHGIVIEGLRRTLDSTFSIVGDVADGLALVDAAGRLQPDVIVTDVSMPLLNGIDAVRQIRQTDVRVRIVFLTMHSDVVYASEALRAGGSAYVLKSSAGTEIAAAVREVLEGGTYLTPTLNRRSVESQIERSRATVGGLDVLSPRRREVVQMVAAGRSTKQIAERLGLSPRTVEFHRYHAMKSLHLHTIAELVQYAIRHGLVGL